MKIKRIIGVGIVIALISITGCNGKAQENVENNSIYDISTEDVYSLSKYILLGGSDEVSDAIGSLSVTNEVYDKLVKNSKNSVSSAVVEQSDIYSSEYNNNSSSDLVIIVDMKINFGNYNKLYLIEWHINSNKEIYGYNVWGY